MIRKSAAQELIAWAELTAELTGTTVEGALRLASGSTTIVQAPEVTSAGAVIREVPPVNSAPLVSQRHTYEPTSGGATADDLSRLISDWKTEAAAEVQRRGKVNISRVLDHIRAPGRQLRSGRRERVTRTVIGVFSQHPSISVSDGICHWIPALNGKDRQDACDALGIH